MADPIPVIPGGAGSDPLGGLGGMFKDIGNIGNLIFGTPPTTVNGTQNIGPQTTTVQNTVDPAAINKVVQDMLEGNGTSNGLAALMQGAMGHGMYGSSMSGLLGNDLVSRIVGEVAKLTSGKTTTTSGQTNTNSQSTQTGANPAAQAAALGALAKALLNSAPKSAPGQGGNSSKDKAPGGPGLGNKSDEDPKNTDDESKGIHGDNTKDDYADEKVSGDGAAAEASSAVGDQITGEGINIDSLAVDVPYTADEASNDNVINDITDTSGTDVGSGNSDVVDNTDWSSLDTGNGGTANDNWDPNPSDEGN